MRFFLHGLIALILSLLWLLFAQHNGWRPYSRPLLGSAFYTNIRANTPAPSADGGSSNGATGNSGSNGETNEFDQGCAVVANVNAQTAGKQEVCTYTEGNKIVTVTYLNDRVISASKSGF